MFNTGSRPTVMKLVVESADSGLESLIIEPIHQKLACGYGP